MGWKMATITRAQQRDDGLRMVGLKCPRCHEEMTELKDPFPARETNVSLSYICSPCRLQVYIWKKPKWRLH
jgi:hypothetical protein